MLDEPALVGEHYYFTNICEVQEIYKRNSMYTSWHKQLDLIKKKKKHSPTLLKFLPHAKHHWLRELQEHIFFLHTLAIAMTK